MAPVFAVRRRQLVGGMCSMLPHNTGICCHAFIYKKKIIASVHCFFILVFQSGIDKSTEWSMITACPSLMCFFSRGNDEGTNSSKILCLMFCVCFVICKVVSGLIFWFDDLREE